MPPRGVKKGSKRFRQYEQIKDRIGDQGGSEDMAEEIAARVLNKERARHGESKTSFADLDPQHLVGLPRRPGIRNESAEGPHSQTALCRGDGARVRGRSDMSKAELGGP